MTITFGYTICYVDDVEATLEFFTAGFGLTPRFVTPEGDYGELDTGATTLAFAATTLARANLDGAGGFTPLTSEAAPPAVSIALITDEVDAAVDRAVEAGARPYLDPVAKPWGQTVAYVLDPNGVLIEIATPVAT